MKYHLFRIRITKLYTKSEILIINIFLRIYLYHKCLPKMRFRIDVNKFHLSKIHLVDFVRFLQIAIVENTICFNRSYCLHCSTVTMYIWARWSYTYTLYHKHKTEMSRILLCSLCSVACHPSE